MESIGREIQLWRHFSRSSATKSTPLSGRSHFNDGFSAQWDHTPLNTFNELLPAVIH